MTERQRRFCEHFAACGNGAEAARLAGYSGRTARAIASELLTKPYILAYVRDLQEEQADARIVSMKTVRAFWCDTMRDTTQKMADRLKASELLAKSAGEFIHLGQDDGGAGVLHGQHNGEDVLIYLPDNGRDPGLQSDPEEMGEVSGWTSGR
ncbi:MAG: terminase small subunit [Ruminiclostridium sp.]|nr:terminase small subunit [Ruminiclostridium sp.]